MNYLQLQNDLRETVKNAAKNLFDVELDALAAETPPRTELGDLAFPAAFELAKRIKQQTGEKQNPRGIAERLKTELEKAESVARVEVAGAGYLNVFFDRARLLAELAAPKAQTDNTSGNAAQRVEKRMVEHTSINPNKAAHIGHVRNSVLGDTFVRILRATGETVEVQNYIDNTGVQVADVVVGFIHLEKMTLDDIEKLDQTLPPENPFDYYCWDLYTRVGLFYRNDDPNGEQNPEKLKLRQETLHLIEAGNNPTAELADYVATKNVRRILETMERLGIRYDVLPRESEILTLKFWQTAFEKMQQLGVIRLETTGKNANCWVMPFGDYTGTDEHDADKILVRSNGTVTYTGKDIAYQLWKLGLLDLDFNYRLFDRYEDGKTVWMTTVEKAIDETDPQAIPSFGSGTTAYNVIDSRQSYPQEIVKRGVAAIAPERGETASIHLSYEMVALSPAAAAELGFQISEADQNKSFVEMSGRKGLGVKADDLINRLEANALIEVEARHQDLAGDKKRETAHVIAVGALRYFLLKFTRNTVIVFDFAEALSFEGETGPYCQYAAVRANSIFRKLEADGLENSHKNISNLKSEISDFFIGEEGTEVWSLVVLAAKLDETLRQSVVATEPAIAAKYTFNLAKAFNLFYHRHKIIAEENQAKRAVLVTVADLARRQLTVALGTLGIQVPERM